MRKFLFASILISLGILFRTLWHVYPNVEFVTAATLLTSCYLGKRYRLFVPFAIMFLSDLIIGNSNIFVFTWSGYMLIGLIFSGTKPLKNAIFASIFFYFWSNFGVWVMDGFGMYAKDLPGLLRCLYMGLPFLRFNLIGNLFFVSLSFFVVEKLKKFSFAGKPLSCISRMRRLAVWE